MNTKEAAILIGCSAEQVGYLIRKGKLKADKTKLKKGDVGFGRRTFVYDLKRSDVVKFAKLPPPGPGARGVSRKNK